MIGNDENEEDRRQKDPPGRERVPPERFPGYSCGYQGQRQANPAKPKVNCFAMSDTTFAVLETLLVFFDDQHRVENTSGISRGGDCPRRLAHVLSTVLPVPARM
jgi:hypothetical protein